MMLQPQQPNPNTPGKVQAFMAMIGQKLASLGPKAKNADIEKLVKEELLEFFTLEDGSKIEAMGLLELKDLPFGDLTEKAKLFLFAAKLARAFGCPAPNHSWSEQEFRENVRIVAASLRSQAWFVHGESEKWRAVRIKKALDFGIPTPRQSSPKIDWLEERRKGAQPIYSHLETLEQCSVRNAWLTSWRQAMNRN